MVAVPVGRRGRDAAEWGQEILDAIDRAWPWCVDLAAAAPGSGQAREHHSCCSPMRGASAGSTSSPNRCRIGTRQIEGVRWAILTSSRMVRDRREARRAAPQVPAHRAKWEG